VGMCVQDHKSLYTSVMVCATLVVQNVLVHFDPRDPKSRSNPRRLLQPWQMHPRCKFGDCRSVACRDNADIIILYDLLKVSQGELVFGLQGLFTSMSLCARFQVSVSSSYDLW